MGDCKYCGQPAGFMRSQHSECRDKHDAATKRIPQAFGKWVEDVYPAADFCRDTRNFAKANFVGEDELRSLTLSAFELAIDKALADHLLTSEEEDRLASLLREFGLTTNDLVPPSGERLIKGAILKDLDEGKVPVRVKIDGHIPLNLARDEKLIWVFQGATFFTMRSKTTYHGRSQGVSIRLMKGVYYRVGDFKGEPIRVEYLSEEATGLLAVTNRAVYFYSPSKTFKIVAKKIIAVDAFSDGISITPDGANPRARLFKIDDPWFAANVITRLNQL
jgi:hypothetical protein